MRTRNPAVVALLLVVSLVSVRIASAQVPFGYLEAGGQRYDISFEDVGDGHYMMYPGAISTGALSASWGGTADADPLITFSVAATNGTSSPVTFGFTYILDMPPLSGPYIVSSALSGTLTDHNGDGVSLTPHGQPAALKGSVGHPLTDMGVDVGPSASHGPTPNGEPASYAYGPFTSGPKVGPGPGPWTQLRADLVFTLSGLGDSVAFDGRVDLNQGSLAVPEPAAPAVALIGASVFGLCLKRRSRMLP